MKIVTETGPSPGGIPLVASTQSAHPPFQTARQRLSYRVGGELPSRRESQSFKTNLIFRVSCFAEVQRGYMCCFEKNEDFYQRKIAA